MALNTAHRTDRPEMMDDFEMEGEVLRDALDKIAKINKLLGGNKLTLQGVQYLLKSFRKTDEIVIVDVGCGNGDMLRNLAEFALENKLNFRLIGIDANNFTVTHATKLSTNYSNISYNCQDIFSESFKEFKYDIVLCTLTLHHFKDQEIKNLLQTFSKGYIQGITIGCPGFFGPQGRILRLPLAYPGLVDKLSNFNYSDHYISNFEMESSAIYGLGRLMGHHCISLNVVVANRVVKEFSKDSARAVDNLIKHSLNIISSNVL